MILSLGKIHTAQKKHSESEKKRYIMPATAFVKELNDAIGAHGAWKLKLRTAISLGKSELSPMEVRCDNKCALGKWLYGPGVDATTKSGMPYKVVKRLHAEFHQTAASVLERAMAGQREQASSLLEGEFKERSDKLVRALTKWKGELAHAGEPDLQNS
jgi:hypothetical protein